MRSFDYSFLENEMFPAKLVNTLYHVAELHGRITLRKDSMSDVLARIEPKAIHDSVSDDERYSDLYREARTIINKNYVRINVSVDKILELHNVILPNLHSQNNGYRYNSYAIKMPGEIKQNVEFQTIPPSDVPESLHQLVNAYTEVSNNVNINHLLLIPCFIFDFLCIRPFKHGNKRMSQLLFLLLLCKNDFEVVRYIPFEEQVNLTKADFDIAFKDSTVDWHKGGNKYFPFIEYCLDILLFCYKELDKYSGQAVTKTKKITKKQRIRDMVLNSTNTISKAEINDELSDVSGTTIEVALGEMVREGIIKKCGGGCNTKYIRTEITPLPSFEVSTK